jgi:hypothetical protein
MCHLTSILLFFSHIYLSDAIFISIFNHFVVFVSIFCAFMLSLSYLFPFSDIKNELQILSDSAAVSAVVDSALPDQQHHNLVGDSNLSRQVCCCSRQQQKLFR